MDYAKQQASMIGAQLGAQATRIDEKPLDSIATATQRVNSAIVRLNDFLERFHGPQANDRADPTPPEPMPCHVGNLSRLSSVLDRLEIAVDAVSRIG